MKKMIFVWFVFVITRLFIWVNRPIGFTEITYSYMPYAHLWAGGTKPYLEQWYEYPPATIPLFFAPHVIDMATNHHPFHLNYLIVYRGILLMVDVGIFILLDQILKRLKTPQTVHMGSLFYYSLITMKANHFIYDSMDLTFAAAMLISATAPIIWKKKGFFIGWIGYFLATALKYVNAPLGLIYAAFERKRGWKLFIQMGLAGLLIWSIPIVMYRSSLRVSFVYHQQRGLQVESAPAQLASTINRFTHTEHYAEVYKNYDIQGPVSTQIKNIFDVIFPLSLLFYGCWAAWIASKASTVATASLKLWMTLGYVSLFMLTAKVLSTPFLLWHIPLVAALPTKSFKKKLPLILVSGIIITASMTSIPDIQFSVFSLHLLIGWIRVVGFLYLFIKSVKAISEQ